MILELGARAFWSKAWILKQESRILVRWTKQINNNTPDGFHQNGLNRSISCKQTATTSFVVPRRPKLMQQLPSSGQAQTPLKQWNRPRHRAHSENLQDPSATTRLMILAFSSCESRLVVEDGTIAWLDISNSPQQLAYNSTHFVHTHSTPKPSTDELASPTAVAIKWAGQMHVPKNPHLSRL